MKRAWKLGVLVALLFLLLPEPLQAAGRRIIDDAGLFDAGEIERLEAKAEDIYQTYGIDTFVITSYNEGFSDNYARDLIEDYGVSSYPQGYIGYAVNMADRSYWIDAYGDEIRGLFTQSRTDGMAEKAADELADGDYGDSAMGFLNDVEKRYAVRTSKYGNLAKLWVYKGRTVLFGFISLILALIAAFILTVIKVSRHRDKNVSTEADAYMSPLDLQGRRDQYVRSYQTRVRRQKSSSSGGGGGGGSSGHTGSGGHF